MNEKKLKLNANAVGVAPLGDPHQKGYSPFEEHTPTYPTAYTNSKSKIKTLTSDNKGITLIALVITIIVMLILVAVTVTIALNGGLFSTAKQAKADTQANIDAEQRLASGRIKVDGKWYDSLEDYTKGIESSDQNDEPSKWAQDTEGNITYDGKPSGIDIGDYVNYKPEASTYSSDKLGTEYTGASNSELTTDTTLNWRVLGVDEKGCLTLISDKPTTKAVYFGDAKGYNNGVYILNDICEKLYSNTKLGIKARSITIEDIEAGFSKDGIAERNKYTDSESGIQYGKTKTYDSNLKYPILYNLEKGSGVGTTEAKEDGIGVSDPYYTESTLTSKEKESDTATSNLTCTQTCYYFEDTLQTYCKNKEFHEMIFKTTNYWLASRYAYCDSDYAGFGLRLVHDANLSWSGLFYSDDDGSTRNSAHSVLRPIVTLGSNITINTVENNGANNPHIIPEIK